MRLRDLWHKRANVNIYDEGCIRSLYDELRQQEQAKQSQQSPTQVVIFSLCISSILCQNRHHRCNDNCLEGKRENYQVCSVQHSVQQLCTVQCTHIMNRPNSLWIGFCLTGPVSLCLDSLWPPCVADVDIIFLPCGFFLSIFFPRLISAAADWMSTILLHMVWP